MFFFFLLYYHFFSCFPSLLLVTIIIALVVFKKYFMTLKKICKFLKTKISQSMDFKFKVSTMNGGSLRLLDTHLNYIYHYLFSAWSPGRTPTSHCRVVVQDSKYLHNDRLTTYMCTCVGQYTGGTVDSGC